MPFPMPSFTHGPVVPAARMTATEALERSFMGDFTFVAVDELATPEAKEWLDKVHDEILKEMYQRHHNLMVFGCTHPEALLPAGARCTNGVDLSPKLDLAKFKTVKDGWFGFDLGEMPAPPPAKPHPLQKMAEQPNCWGQSMWRPWDA